MICCNETFKKVVFIISSNQVLLTKGFYWRRIKHKFNPYFLYFSVCSYNYYETETIELNEN